MMHKWFCQGCGWLSASEVQTCRDCGGKMGDLSGGSENIGHYVGMKRREIEYRRRIREHGLDPDDVKKKVSAAIAEGLGGDALKAVLLSQGVDLELVKRTLGDAREAVAKKTGDEA